MSATDTITLEELAAAFREGVPFNPSANAATAAEQVYAHAVRNREPEYERGHFYEDALGRVFFRLLGDGDGWSSAPEGTPYPGDYPQRPLRKLIPEPAGGTWSRREIERILAGYVGFDRAAEVATCILGVLDKECQS